VLFKVNFAQIRAVKIVRTQSPGSSAGLETETSGLGAVKTEHFSIPMPILSNFGVAKANIIVYY